VRIIQAAPFIFEVIMNITPLANKIVIKRIEGSKKTESGIILQRTDEPDRAEVMAIGPDVDEVSVGDIVLLDWNAAMKSGDYYVAKIDGVVFVYGE
jgi:co-chaperonin GroES (HSP10)